MRQAHGLLVGIPVLAVGLAAGVPALTEVPYEEVQQVFDAKCVACHSGAQPARGLRLDSWEGVVAGSEHGEAIIAYDADNSLLLELVTELVGGPHPVELGAEALTEKEIDLLRTWIEEGAAGESGQIPFADAEDLLYVTNQGEAMVSVIDMEANQVVRTVDLTEHGFPRHALPHHVAVEPDGSYWYVSLIAGNAVLKFDRANNLVGQVEIEWPGLLALDPNSDLLFVGRSMASVDPPRRLGVIRRSEMSLEEIEMFLPRPHGLAVDPGGSSVFVSSLAVNQLAVVDPVEQSTELAPIEGERPHVLIHFAISPDGTSMVATSEITSKLFVFDLERAPDMTPVDEIDVPMAPWHPVFTPDGRWVYFGNNWDNSVTVVDMDTRAVARVIRGDGIAQPHGSAVSPDGSYVYIASRNLKMPEGHTKAAHVYHPRYDLGDNAHIGTVVVIDTDTQEIAKVIEIENYGSGLGTAARRD